MEEGSERAENAVQCMRLQVVLPFSDVKGTNDGECSAMGEERKEEATTTQINIAIETLVNGKLNATLMKRDSVWIF